MLGPRKDYLEWDDFWMAKALLSAKRSKDPSTQVGACIVSADNRPIASGYNGFPRGISSSALPWDRSGAWAKTKYPYVCHAESNAIDNSNCGRDGLVGSKIYTTLFPCNECSKRIIQNGIKEVIYLSDKYHDTDESKVSRDLFQYAGIKTRQLIYDITKVITIELKNE